MASSCRSQADPVPHVQLRDPSRGVQRLRSNRHVRHVFVVRPHGREGRLTEARPSIRAKAVGPPRHILAEPAWPARHPRAGLIEADIPVRPLSGVCCGEAGAEIVGNALAARVAPLRTARSCAASTDTPPGRSRRERSARSECRARSARPGRGARAGLRDRQTIVPRGRWRRSPAPGQVT